MWQCLCGFHSDANIACCVEVLLISQNTLHVKIVAWKCVDPEWAVKPLKCSSGQCELFEDRFYSLLLFKMCKSLSSLFWSDLLTPSTEHLFLAHMYCSAAVPLMCRRVVWPLVLYCQLVFFFSIIPWGSANEVTETYLECVTNELHYILYAAL